MIFPQPENHAGAATTLPLSACAVGEKPGMYGSPEENAGEPGPVLLLPIFPLTVLLACWRKSFTFFDVSGFVGVCTAVNNTISGHDVSGGVSHCGTSLFRDADIVPRPYFGSCKLNPLPTKA